MKKTKSSSKQFFLGRWLASRFKFLHSHLDLELKQAGLAIDTETYLASIYNNTFFTFVVLCIVFAVLLKLTGKPVAYSLLFAVVLTLVLLPRQFAKPKLLAKRRVTSIEQNLLAALQQMLIQLRSGVPLFNILVDIANSDYGELSKEFSKAVKAINAGIPADVALADLAEETPSLYFRRAVWQISNGLKAGSDMENVIADIINSLAEQQLIAIQQYGSKLNPLAMFYMLIAVILPALAITFTIVLTSLISLSEITLKFLLFGIYFFVLFFQFIFLGLIKSNRPALLG